MASTHVEEFNDIAGIFLMGWGKHTPIAWPNLHYSPIVETPYVRFTILHAASRQETIGAPGSNIVRYPGIVDIQIFVPKMSGVSAINALVDKALEIYDNADLEGYLFSRGYSVNISSSSDDGWFQTDVRIPYHRDSFK